MKKQMLQCLGALTLAAALGGAAAFAAEPVPTATVTGEGEASQAVEFKATIAPAILDVALPANISFSVDLSRGGDQVISPSAAVVQNRSLVPVKVEVTAVAEPQAGALPVRLKQTLAEVRGTGDMLLALGPAGLDMADPAGLQAVEGLALTAAGPQRTLAAKVNAQTELALQVYGHFAFDAGYRGGEFTVTPTLKISAWKP